jgi:cysteine desulfurase
MKNQIYLDNNSTTQLNPIVLSEMTKDLKGPPYNPSSTHIFGQKAKNILIEARNQVASFFNVKPNQIFFTSGGTESINMAIRGLLKNKNHGHIISTKIEHASIYNTLIDISKKDFSISYLDIKEDGSPNLLELEKLIKNDTCLIVLSSANSETGVTCDISEIAEIAERHNIRLVIDAVASLGKEKILIPSGVSAICFSAHKIHGPKGIGLTIFNNKKFEPLITGGPQQYNKRAGTENLAGIIGFAKALYLIEKTLSKDIEKMAYLRDLFEKELLEIPGIKINGSGKRICNTSNLCFSDIDGESLLINLDLNGVMASLGSACSVGLLEPSRVLLNMGFSKKRALSSLRFSLSRLTTKEEVHKSIKIIKKILS